MPVVREVMSARAFDAFVLPNSYFVEADRVFILHLAKSGSTTLQAAFLRAEGIDPEEVCEQEPAPEIVWSQGVWMAVPRLTQRFANLSGERQAYCLESPDVQRVGFVRHPVVRLWSAWVSKIVIGEPAFAAHRDATLGPFNSDAIDPSTTRAALAQHFDDFVQYLIETPTIAEDAHFMPQAAQLAGRPGDTLIYDLTGLDDVLRSRVPSIWRVAVPRRFNDTQRLIDGPIVLAKTQAVIAEHFAVDFAEFGDLWPESASATWSVEDAQRPSPITPELVLLMRAARRLTRVLESQDDCRESPLPSEDTHDCLRAELDGVYASTSWRITRPLRACRDLWGRVRP